MADRHLIARPSHCSWFALLATCSLLLASLGCGRGDQVIPGRVIVSGVVTFDGQPLPAGTIAFTSQDNGALTGATSIRSGGKYLTDRAPIGRSLVTVETESVQLGNPGARFVPIPAKYNETTTSGLETTLEAGKNENVNFVLEKAR